jgi:hypothetical protein
LIWDWPSITAILLFHHMIYKENLVKRADMLITETVEAAELDEDYLLGCNNNVKSGIYNYDTTSLQASMVQSTD